MKKIKRGGGGGGLDCPELKTASFVFTPVRDSNRWLAAAGRMLQRWHNVAWHPKSTQPLPVWLKSCPKGDRWRFCGTSHPDDCILSWSTFGLNPTIWPVDTGNQWTGPMKRRILWLVRATGFPYQLIGSSDWVRKCVGDFRVWLGAHFQHCLLIAHCSLAPIQHLPHNPLTFLP